MFDLTACAAHPKTSEIATPKSEKISPETRKVRPMVPSLREVE